MRTSAIRDRLYDYIRVADEKKIKAIYAMLEDEIDESVKWWEDDKFVAELDKEYADWKSGRTKGYTITEVAASIEEMKQKRRNK